MSPYYYWSWMAQMMPFYEQGNLYELADTWARGIRRLQLVALGRLLGQPANAGEPGSRRHGQDLDLPRRRPREHPSARQPGWHQRQCRLYGLSGGGRFGGRRNLQWRPEPGNSVLDIHDALYRHHRRHQQHPDGRGAPSQFRPLLRLVVRGGWLGWQRRRRRGSRPRSYNYAASLGCSSSYVGLQFGKSKQQPAIRPTSGATTRAVPIFSLAMAPFVFWPTAPTRCCRC